MRKIFGALAALCLSSGLALAQDPTGTNTNPGCIISGSTITCGSSSLTPGTGTVSSVSVTTQNGVSAVVTNPTTTPALAFTLGAITPTSAAIGGATIGTDALSWTGTATGSGKFRIGGGSYTSDDSAVLVNRAATNPLGSGGSHAVRDEGTYQQSSGSGGYASFDAIPTASGSLSYNHVRSFQARPTITATATVSAVEGIFVQPNVTGTGPVTGSYGLYMADANGSGAITNQYAIWCDTLTRGSSGNYCIYNGGTSPSYFGGNVQVGAKLYTSGNISAAAWTTSGVRYANVTGTLTDTSSTGTVAAAYTNIWPGDTIAASSATTYTAYYGSYFTAPVAGTNVTLTKSYGLGADTARFATSLGIGIDPGSNALQVSGTAFISGTSTLAGGVAGNTNFSGNISITSGSGVIASSSLDASSSTGGALQVSGGASVAKRFWLPAITSSSGLQTAVLCQSSGGEVIADSVACLASSARFKNIRGSLSGDVIKKFMKLPIKIWAYKPEGIFKEGVWTRDRVGPIAEDVAELDPRLAEYDRDGNVRAYSTEQLLAYTIKVVQEQQGQINDLRASANRKKL